MNQIKGSMSLPIVGVASSWKGLESLALFLAQIPINTGIAFVIVQDWDRSLLSEDQEKMLSQKEIEVQQLQNHTLLPIYQIQDQLELKPNTIYLTPKNCTTSILHNVIKLCSVSAQQKYSPIDFFFQSLAEDKQHLSIGVVLSGLKTETNFALHAIKENNGAVFVQEPNTTMFDMVLQNIVESELADVCAGPKELPDKIIRYLHHLANLNQEIKVEEFDLNAIKKILSMINSELGHDFSQYKKKTIYRRIERRLNLHQFSSIEQYIQFIKENKHELQLLFKELLIGVTRFFRDPSVWEQLKNEIMPMVFLNHNDGDILRAWVAGCSTGEEAYSLAIIFKEALNENRFMNKKLSLQIFATDLDKDTIKKARTGLFPHNIALDVSKERLHHFFIEEENGYRVKKEIREMVIFAPQNITMDPPFTKLDFLTCRNLLIYLNTELQKKLMFLFHYSLSLGGVMILGNAETIGSATYLFAPFPGKTRIYKRLESSGILKYAEFPTSFSRPFMEISTTNVPQTQIERFPPNHKLLVESILLQIYCPPAVLVTYQGDILYISGKTGTYLEPATGKANLNLFSMAREGLKQALSESFQKSVRQQSPIVVRGVKIKVSENNHAVDVTIHPFTDHEEYTGMVLVVFHDVHIPKEINSYKIKSDNLERNRILSLIEELEHSQETLQMTRLEMQNSQEELKSANEELQSTNEELQSTNEELTTSKEEMQSINEELQTINNELHIKIEELSRTSNDMHNLLNSTDIAILFLDDVLKIRKFTNQITHFMKLIPDDIGRQITDFASDLDYPSLATDAREVLRTLIYKETQVPTNENRWFNVKIMPYRTLENKIEGVVITFTDISVSKQLEFKLRKSGINLQNLLNESFQQENLSEIMDALTDNTS